MDKNSILVKLLLDHVILNNNIPISESALVAVYEDKEIAESLDHILLKIQQTCSGIKDNIQLVDEINKCEMSEPQIRLLLPYLQSQSQQANTSTDIEKEQLLKPGQIPTAEQLNRDKTPIVAVPTATIVIPNGRMGMGYEAQIQISLDNGEAAIIERIDLPEDLGLVFDTETLVLSGIPQQSGNMTIPVVWAVSGQKTHTTEVTFIINPDPRTLWQINEPPADCRYPKKHIDHQVISEGDWHIAAASRRGRSHEHAGSFRDDDFYIHHDTQSGWSIMIAADGAGSAKNSREGSRIAVNTFGEYIKQQVAAMNTSGIANFMNLLTAWDVEATKQIGNYFAKLFHNAAQLAINNIKNEAIQIDQPVKSFSTTLLATASLRIGDELFAASFWMGDGAIAVYGPKGRVRLLGTPDSGEYAGQTRFLDENEINDLEFNRRIGIGKWADVSHLILMTDGVSDPIFETDNGLKEPQHWDDLIAQITPCLAVPAEADRELANWLTFFSTGNHDDRTIIVSW